MRLVLALACLCLATVARSQDASPTASQNAASPAEPTNATQESAHFETEDPNSFAAKAIEIQDESDERGVSSEQTSEKSKEKDHSEPEVGSKTNHSSETRRRQLNLQEFNETDVNFMFSDEYIVIKRGPHFETWANDLGKSINMGNGNGSAYLYPATFVVGIKVHTPAEDTFYSCETDAREKGIPFSFMRGRVEAVRVADRLEVSWFDDLDKRFQSQDRSQSDALFPPANQHVQHHAWRGQGQVQRDSQAVRGGPAKSSLPKSFDGGSFSSRRPSTDERNRVPSSEEQENDQEQDNQSESRSRGKRQHNHRSRAGQGQPKHDYEQGHARAHGHGGGQHRGFYAHLTRQDGQNKSKDVVVRSHKINKDQGNIVNTLGHDMFKDEQT